MKKVKDIKSSSRAWWMAENPDALSISRSELLRSDWDDVTGAVKQEGKAVVLLEHKDMVGLIVPPSFLYEHHRKMPHLSEMDPIMHISVDDYRNEPSLLAGHVENGGSAVLLDQEGKPALAVVSRGFAIDIQADAQSTASFKEPMAAFMFNDRALTQEELDDKGDLSQEELDYLGDLAGDYMAALPKMSDSDLLKLQKAISAMNMASQDRHGIDGAVESLSFD